MQTDEWRSQWAREHGADAREAVKSKPVIWKPLGIGGDLARLLVSGFVALLPTVGWARWIAVAFVVFWFCRIVRTVTVRRIADKGLEKDSVRSLFPN